jgi:FkbM family methyltransferase
MSLNTHAATILGDAGCIAVDCGAARGLLPHWRNLLGIAALYLFEPDESAHPEIFRSLEAHGYQHARGRSVEVIGKALSARGGPRVLHVTNVPTGSSLFDLDLEFALEYADRDYLLPIRDVSIETHTLAAALPRDRIARVDMMKLDTQGAELEILQGLDDERMGNVLSIELEIAMHRATRGQPTFADVQAFMDARDMELFDLVPKRTHLKSCDGGDYHRAVFGTYANAPTIAPRLWEVDAMYFKKAEVVLAKRDEAAVRRLCLAYCTYGFFAHAHKLLDRATSAAMIDAAGRDRLQSAIVEWHRRLHWTTAPLNVVERAIYKLVDRVADAADPPPAATRNNY